jgi:biotin-dependent carboxylase-like uncharacterized protein
MFEVTQANFLALIQDRGRVAKQLGFTSGGAMDQKALEQANQLLLNPQNAAAIEITYGAFSITSTKSAWVSITGADLQAKHNEQPAPHWQNFKLNAGDTLKFIQPKSGLRAYLAVAGGFQTDIFLGSRSAVVREGLSGYCGRKLQKQDKLPVLDQLSNDSIRSIPEPYRHFVTECDGSYEIGFYPSYQWQLCSEEAKVKFLNSDYEITNAADRMGYRLSGANIDMQDLRLVSEGIVSGSIQVPADGQPIVLMRDHQTIGGYPKLGVVSEFGVNLLAQLKPSDKVRFIAIV